jgi:hypothetical protein
VSVSQRGSDTRQELPPTYSTPGPSKVYFFADLHVSRRRPDHPPHADSGADGPHADRMTHECPGTRYLPPWGPTRRPTARTGPQRGDTDKLGRHGVSLRMPDAR